MKQNWLYIVIVDATDVYVRVYCIILLDLTYMNF